MEFRLKRFSMIRTAVGVMIAALTAGMFASAARADYSDGGGFTAPGYGSRSWGMGGVVAIGGTEEAVYWNPALLSELDRNRVGLSYVNLVPGAEAYQSQIAYAHVLKRGPENEPGLAFNIHTVGVLYENLRLTLADGQKYSENSLRFSYAYSPMYFLTVGASFAFLKTTSDVINFDANGSLIDIGGRIALVKDVTMGIVFRNVLSELRFEDDLTIDLPVFYVVGFAYTGVRHLSLEGNVQVRAGDVSRSVFGGEYRFFDNMLAVRLGLSSQAEGVSRTVPHMGLGFEYQRVRLDYNANFDKERAFDTTHRFSLGYGF